MDFKSCDNLLTKWNLRNIILEGLFLPRLTLRFPPNLAGKRNWMPSFHQPLQDENTEIPFTQNFENNEFCFQLDHFWGAFVIYMIGVLCAGLIFLSEKLFATKKAKDTKKRSHQVTIAGSSVRIMRYHPASRLEAW